MSSIDSNSQTHLNTILDKIGVKSEESKKPASKDNLGQEDFLKLMTTQLQNQD
ncbi:MAG: flagellar hook capping FlgD N-terminal domain-containing protein, partial [Alphaproteobacteria bacterium]